MEFSTSRLRISAKKNPVSVDELNFTGNSSSR
jgi:hypothetical protein